jgi:hypothetical protein
MQEISYGAGLAALGFWLFIAAIVAAGIWESIRKRESQHETLRRIIESGQPIDADLTDKLLSLSGGNQQLDRDLKVGGVIMLFIAPGLLLMGWIMSIYLNPKIFGALLGVSALVLCIGVGLLAAGTLAARGRRDDARLGID